MIQHISQIAGVTVVGTALTGVAAAQDGGLSDGMGGGMGGGMYGYGGPLLWTLVLLVVVGLAYVAIAQRSSASNENGESDPALATLREQYARGELSEEEFEKRRKRLSRTR